MRQILHYPSGKPIDWFNDELDSTMMVMWSKRDLKGRIVRGSLRTIAHLNYLNDEAVRLFGVEIEVIQPPYNTGVEASAGTHDYDVCWDVFIPGISWWTQQRFFRKRGSWCWYRHYPLFSNHIHGGCLPIPEGRVRSDDFATRVGVYVPGQLIDYYNRAFGLKNQHTPHSDKSWFPADIDAVVFDLDKEIERQKELHMEYNNWSQESKDALARDLVKALIQGVVGKVRKTKNVADGFVSLNLRQMLARAASAVAITKESEDDIISAIDELDTDNGEEV